MKPAAFRYHAPDSVAGVLDLLATHGEEARLLAGGQSLVPLMNLRMVRPAVLIDLNRCAGLAGVTPRDGQLAIGPMTRQSDAERDRLVRRHCPMIAEALSFAGPVAVRNRATVGGTLAHADRSAEMPGVALALGATFLIDGVGGPRRVAAEDFFLGDLTTAVQPGQMLREIAFPIPPDDAVAVFVESGTRARDLALAGVALLAVVGRDGGWSGVRIALIGVEATPLRLTAVERLVEAEGAKGAVAAGAARAVAAAIDPLDDVHASAAYRRRLAGALVERALDLAHRRWEEGHAGRHH